MSGGPQHHPHPRRRPQPLERRQQHPRQPLFDVEHDPFHAPVPIDHHLPHDAHHVPHHPHHPILRQPRRLRQHPPLRPHHHVVRQRPQLHHHLLGTEPLLVPLRHSQPLLVSPKARLTPPASPIIQV